MTQDGIQLVKLRLFPFAHVVQLRIYVATEKENVIQLTSKPEGIPAGEMKVALRCVVVRRENGYRWLYRVRMSGQVVDQCCADIESKGRMRRSVVFH